MPLSPPAFVWSVKELVELCSRVGPVLPLPMAASHCGYDARTFRRLADEGRISKLFVFSVQVVAAADLHPEVLASIDNARLCQGKTSASRQSGVVANCRRRKAL